MTRVPQLRDALVEAAERRMPARKRRSLHSWWIGAGLSLAVAGTAGAVAIVTGTVGGAPSQPYPERDEFGNRFPNAPVVIGTDQIKTGRIEVIAYRMRSPGKGRDLLCVDIAGPDSGRGGSCNTGLPRRASGIRGTGMVGEPSPTLATGATTAPVSRIEVSYARNGDTGTRTAALHPVRSEIAKQLETKPFTYYTAALPPQAQPLRATAYDETGRTLWRARFPTFSALDPKP